MTLTCDEATRFFRIHCALLWFANERLGMLPSRSTPEEFGPNIDNAEALRIRNALWDDPREIMQDFVARNPASLEPRDLDVARAWEHGIRGRFYVLRFLKKHAIFFDPSDRVYGVLGLTESIETKFGSHRLPLFVEALLVPFEGRIVYDGILRVFPIHLGGGIRRMLGDVYRRAKDRGDVITSLPAAVGESSVSDADLLRSYLATERSRQENAEEIEGLVLRSPELERLYHLEMGKVDSRRIRKALRNAGVRDAWFGVLEGTVVASGRTRDELEESLARVLPAARLERVHRFRFRATQ